MAKAELDDMILYLIANEKSGVTVREAQDHFKISAKTAKDLLQKFGKPHVYKGSGMSYILNDAKFKNEQIDAITKNRDKYESIRKQILDWLHQGNVDIEAWANDPLKRPPSFFVKAD